MTQTDDNRDQQTGTPQQHTPAPHFAATPPPPCPGAQGYWQWQPTAPGPVFVQQPAPAPKTNSTAIFAFVMAIVWLGGVGSLLAVIFGIMGAKECERTGESGNGLATAAAILGILGLFFSLVFFAASH